MVKFGEYLIEQRAVSLAQVEEAVRSQSVYGGLLGTNLLERGYVLLEELAIHLSGYHGIPMPPPDLLEAPDERAINVVPMPLIRRCKVLPFKLEKHRIHVVMIDPKDRELLQYLEMAAEREVVPYVLPEAQLLYWLEIHLDIDRHPRMLALGTRPRQLDLGSDEEMIPATEPLLQPEENHGTNRLPANPAPEEAAPAEGCDDDEDILLLDELVCEPEPSREMQWELQAKADNTNDPESLTSSRIANLEAQLFACSERDEIVRLGLHISRVHSRAAALFLVRADGVRGFRADGDGMQTALVDIEIPLETASILTHPATTRLPFRGPPPSDGIDGRLLASIGRGDAQEVFVHPIVIGDRVVNLLYADNGPDAFGETSIAALTALCDCLARAYERLITESKKSSDD